MHYKTFEPIAHRYDIINTVFTLGLVHLYRRHTFRIMKPFLKQAHVLDIGCGTGAFLKYLMQSSPLLLHGLEPSKYMLEIAYKRHPQILFFETTLENFKDFEQNFYDVCILNWVFRNLDDVSISAQRLSDLIKPGGHLFILDSFLPKNFIARYLFSLQERILLNVFRWLKREDFFQSYRYYFDSVKSFTIHFGEYEKALEPFFKKQAEWFWLGGGLGFFHWIRSKS